MQAPPLAGDESVAAVLVASYKKDIRFCDCIGRWRWLGMIMEYSSLTRIAKIRIIQHMLYTQL